MGQSIPNDARGLWRLWNGFIPNAHDGLVWRTENSSIADCSSGNKLEKLVILTKTTPLVSGMVFCLGTRC